jgi:hypothetical protein
MVCFGESRGFPFCAALYIFFPYNNAASTRGICVIPRSITRYDKIHAQPESTADDDMTLQQEVKEEILWQLHDGQWHTPDEIWRRVTSELLDNPAQEDKTMEALLIETYAAVQQTLIHLALERHIESTKDGRIRIKPER